MKSLTEQYVNFWFVINELPSSGEDTEAAYKLFDAAHAELEQLYRTLPGHKQQLETNGFSYEVARYELCASDACAEDRGGFFAWPVCITAPRDLSNDLLIEFKTLAERLFAEQAKREGGSARLVSVDKYNVYRVTETVEAQL